MQFRKLIRIAIFFLNLVAINLLASNAGKCTSKSEDDMEKEKAIHLSSKDLHMLKEVELKQSDKLDSILANQDKGNNPIEILNDDALIIVFGFLKIEDLGRLSQVSHRWLRVSTSPQLWRKVGLINYGDYFTPENLLENPLQKVIHHYLSERFAACFTPMEFTSGTEYHRLKHTGGRNYTCTGCGRYVFQKEANCDPMYYFGSMICGSKKSMKYKVTNPGALKAIYPLIETIVHPIEFSEELALYNLESISEQHYQKLLGTICSRDDK